MTKQRYLRKAKHDYTCTLCNGVIKAGEEYVDNETVKSNEHETIISHDRAHKACPKKSHKIILTEPEPCSHMGEKFWLVGVAYNPDNVPALLVRNWENTKYQWKDYVISSESITLTPKNVEFNYDSNC